MFIPKTGDIYNGSTYIGYRDLVTGYFSGDPLENTSIGVPSASNERYVGNDDINSRIEFDVAKSPTFMHLPSWVFSFYTDSASTNGKVYTEGIDTDTTFQNAIQATTDGKLNVLCRATTGVYTISITTTASVFTGASKKVTVEKFANGDIVVSTNGMTDTFNTGVTATLEQANTSTIGALVRTTVSNSAFGTVWDVNKNGEFIPLNEGTGTDIHNASGVVVGTLTDTNGVWWDRIVSSWFIISDNPCGDNHLVTHNNIGVVFNGEFVTHEE